MIRVSVSCFLTLSMLLPMAHGSLTTFIAQDNSPGSSIVGTDAAAARNDFLAALGGGVGTEDFEGIAVGTDAPLSLIFPGSTGSITATLTGGGAEIIGSPGSGRFATSGSNYVGTSSGGDFNIGFSSPIAAFGFFGTDLGDFGGDLILTLSNGTTETITVPTSGAPNGALVFVGFTDNMNTYTSVGFTNTGSADVFGFDDLTIGDIGQVTSTPPPPPPPAAVPEPSSLAIWCMTGLLGIAYWRQRKR